MYIKVKNKKIPIYLKTTFKEKFKSLKFKLEKIDFGICFIKKRIISTYFFCQPVDIIITDKNNKILKMFKGVSSERFYRGPKKSYFSYILPQNTSDYFNIDDYFDITLSKEDEAIINKTKKDN